MTVSRTEQRESNPFVEGTFVIVDKPLRWTSFDIVNKFRYILSRKLGVKRIKVGHAGTLDPLATGVVVICTGKHTKLIEQTMGLRKTYEATIRLGATTPSYDLETEIDATYPMEGVDRERIEAALETFVGEIDQVPPLFSAVRIDGKRAYEHARKGDDVALPPKRVVVYSIEVLECDLPDVRVRIECGRGTYIRSLARDLGEKLGCGGHLTQLRRTRVGSYDVRDAIGVEDFEAYVDRILEGGGMENKSRSEGVL